MEYIRKLWNVWCCIDAHRPSGADWESSGNCFAYRKDKSYWDEWPEFEMS
jgi:hypothetical protein